MTGIERLADIANDGPYSGGMIHISVQKLREICEQIEREVDDISGHESDVLAFVGEKGGLDELKKQFEASDRSCNRKTFYDRLALGWIEENGGLDAVKERTMPEGMSWPFFGDGEPVRSGDKLLDKDGDWFVAVSFVFTCDWWSIRGYQTEGFGDLNDKTRRTLEGMSYGVRVKRPVPKVLDAEGVEIREGDTVYLLPGDWCDEFPCLGYHGGEELEVFSLHADHVVGGIGCRDTRRPKGTCYPQPSQLTHRAPVLAADGEPLEVGQTVYHIADGKEYTVEELFKDCAMVTPDGITGGRCRAEYLTHERPDSWERLEEHKDLSPFDYCKKVGHKLDTFEDAERFKSRDLVRRAKALAGDA